ncbi:hypothetical protein RitSun_55 [Mycobacterium phage RitSun]|nr:hypothetical protein RitSun_55 [Mycobacterium phage RitSun]
MKTRDDLGGGSYPLFMGESEDPRGVYGEYKPVTV